MQKNPQVETFAAARVDNALHGLTEGGCAACSARPSSTQLAPQAVLIDSLSSLSLLTKYKYTDKEGGAKSKPTEQILKRMDAFCPVWKR